MDLRFLEIAACPACLGTLRLDKPHQSAIEDGELHCIGCQRAYAVKGGLPLLLLRDRHWEKTELEIEGEREFVEEMPLAEHIKRNRFESGRTWNVLKELAIPPNPRVLDVGGSSGIGAYLFQRFQARVVIVDIVPDLLKVGEACLEGRMDFQLAAASMEWLPFPDETFDIVFCRQALHHSADPPLAAREFFRVTRPGGRVLVLGEPCVSVVDRIRRSLASWRAPRSDGNEILSKLPDADFQYMWTDFRRLFQPFTRDCTMSRAHGAAGAYATPEGILFDPFRNESGRAGRMLEHILPFGLGKRGDINITATKTQPVRRMATSTEARPVKAHEINVPHLTVEERKSQRRIFEEFFEGMEWG